MNAKELTARENLLRVAHSIIGEEIKDTLPGPHDDAQAEHNEERLIVAARELTDATQSRKCATGHPLDQIRATETAAERMARQ